MKLDRVIAVRNNKTIYRDGDRAIKVFNAEYSKADVLNEALNQARIEETGLNIPKVLEVTMIDGKWAIVSEFIKGKTLSQLMEENPEKKSEYIELLVDLQMSVHAQLKGLEKPELALQITTWFGETYFFYSWLTRTYDNGRYWTTGNADSMVVATRPEGIRPAIWVDADKLKK